MILEARRTLFLSFLIVSWRAATFACFLEFVFSSMTAHTQKSMGLSSGEEGGHIFLLQKPSGPKFSTRKACVVLAGSRAVPFCIRHTFVFHLGPYVAESHLMTARRMLCPFTVALILMPASTENCGMMLPSQVIRPKIIVEAGCFVLAVA